MDADRIAVLERELSRLQRVTAMLAAGFLLLLVWRLLPGPPALEAREFRLRDARGAVRGALGMLDEERPMLRLNDVNGKARALLYLNPDRGGTLRLLDTGGESRLAFLLTDDGRPEIHVADAGGRTRTWLGLATAHRAALIVGDSAGVFWTTPLRSAGTGN